MAEAVLCTAVEGMPLSWDQVCILVVDKDLQHSRLVVDRRVEAGISALVQQTGWAAVDQ